MKMDHVQFCVNVHKLVMWEAGGHTEVIEFTCLTDLYTKYPWYLLTVFKLWGQGSFVSSNFYEKNQMLVTRVQVLSGECTQNHINIGKFVVIFSLIKT